MKLEFLECGEVVTTHGIKGELKVYPWSDTPDFLKEFRTVYTDGGKTPWTITSCRAQKNMTLLKLKGIETIEEAVMLRGKTLYIRRADAKLEEGDYFIQELIGLSVVDRDTGRVYGTLTDVSQTGANDVYHITDGEGQEWLIPAIPQVIQSVDLEGEKMIITPLEGLFDEMEEVND